MSERVGVLLAEALEVATELYEAARVSGNGAEVVRWHTVMLRIGWAADRALDTDAARATVAT